MGVIILGL